MLSKLEPAIIKSSETVDTLELIQISDPHLFADESGSLLGVNTRESFLATLDLIQANHLYIDLIIVTGDISQDLSAESYEFFAQAMKVFNCPIYCLAGNHDEVDALESLAEAGHIKTNKQLDIKNWQILLAHSQVKGKVHGLISSDEMHWIQQQLNTNDSNALVFTHHHPVYSNADWIDDIGIKNCEEFTAMLSEFKQVKACGFGHIHQDLSVTQQNIDYYSAPSTCIQFKQNSSEFAVSEELPGYRIYHCYPSGKVETQVIRVNDFKLSLDMTATGY